MAYGDRRRRFEQGALRGGFEGGFKDGPAATAMFLEPRGVCAAPDGSYFVADTGNHVVRWITPPPNRMVITIAGTPGEPGHVDGAGTIAKLRSPYGITRDQHGVLYVTEGDCRYGSRLRSIWPFPDLPGRQWVVTTAVQSVYLACIIVDGHGVAVTSAGTPIVVEGAGSIARGCRVGFCTPKGEMHDMGCVDFSYPRLFVQPPRVTDSCVNHLREGCLTRALALTCDFVSECSQSLTVMRFNRTPQSRLSASL